MKTSKFIIGLILLLVTMAACSSASPTQLVNTPQPPTSTRIPPTSTPLPPTLTATATGTYTPTASETPTPTSTPTSTSTPVPTSTPTQTPTKRVQVGLPEGIIVKYLVHQGTGGSTGCGDSLIAVSADFLRTGDVREDVKIALNSLFSIRTQYVGILYNPLYQSKVRVNSVSFNKSARNVTVHLTGPFTKPKEDCDKLLYRAQVWDTARQFPEVKHATIWMNEYLLGDLLVVGDN
ncbi:hypothetical protein ACFLY4_08210 [Chloroflexota bacterium]